MQTQKAREGAKSCPEIIKKKPPLSSAASAATNNKSGKKKNTTIASDSNSAISSSSSSVTPTNTPPKLAERKLPEKKKRPATAARVSELESEVAHLEEDVKKAKEQLRSSESSRRQAQYEAGEAIKRLSLMADKLEESQQQLMDLSNSEDDRVQQLRKLSQERDRAWQSELEAVQSQKSMETAALASAMNEIKKLRLQLGTRAAAESETLRNELADCRESEAQAMELLRNTEKQLEIANVTADTLRSELERLRDQMHSNDDDQELRDEANKLRCGLEAAETRYQEEYIQSTLQIRSAYEQVELAKQESCQRQTALEEDMEKLRMDLSEMKGSLRDKEMQLQMLSEENKALREEIISSNNTAAAALAKEEGDESNKRATENITQQQLEAANSELRRLKVQSEQWRKAVEVATSMLIPNNNTTGKLPSSTVLGSSPPNYSTEDMEDESPKRKNMMLKKIGGVLWKKGQNKQ